MPDNYLNSEPNVMQIVKNMLLQRIRETIIISSRFHKIDRQNHLCFCFTGIILGSSNHRMLHIKYITGEGGEYV